MSTTTIHVVLTITNVVVVPCFAIALADPDCLSNLLLVSAPPVYAEWTGLTCNNYKISHLSQVSCVSWQAKSLCHQGKIHHPVKNKAFSSYHVVLVELYCNRFVFSLFISLKRLSTIVINAAVRY